MVGTGPDGDPGRRAGVHRQHDDAGRNGVGRARGRRGHSQPPGLGGGLEQAHRRTAVQRVTVVGPPGGRHGGRVLAHQRQVPISRGVRPAVQPVLQRVQDQMAAGQRRQSHVGLPDRRMLLRHHRFLADMELDRRQER